MTTSSTRPDASTAARLDALRSALARPTDAADPAATGPEHDVPAGPTPDAELAGRLRARRSAAHVAAAYSAAHGHPWQDDGGGRPRWSLAGTTALAAVGVLLAVVLVVAAVAWPRAGSTDLGVDVGGDRADVVAHGDAATDGAAEGLPTPEQTPGPTGGATDDPAAVAEPAGSEVVVHVAGRVHEPGLVTLPAGARVADAIEAAGGATDDAELAAVNLARDVVDGEQVFVPAPGEAAPAVAAGPTGGGAATGTGAATSGSVAPVAVNTADAATLEELPGVGPVLAAAIIAWRDEHGPFTSVEELTEVSGIGPVMLENLRDLVVV